MGGGKKRLLCTLPAKLSDNNGVINVIHANTKDIVVKLWMVRTVHRQNQQSTLCKYIIFK